jgi:alpha-glucosidase (family GH31 glycosyl hydrolase)
MLNNAVELGPLMKPMALVYPNDERFRECWDQYLFGGAFLVAPMYLPGNARNVVLPNGDWYDYYTGKKFVGGKQVEVSKPIDEMPVFVKAGSLYAKGQVVTGNSKLWLTGEDYVDLFFAPGASCTFDFMGPGSRSKIHITAQKLSEKQYSISIPEHVLFKDLYVVGNEGIKSVTKNGKRVKIKYGKGSPTRYIENISGTTLVVEFE